MTVKEAIEALSEYPDDAVVLVVVVSRDGDFYQTPTINSWSHDSEDIVCINRDQRSPKITADILNSSWRP